jgi:hypothetical protein
MKRRKTTKFTYQPHGAVSDLLPPDPIHLRGLNALLIGNAIVEYEVQHRQTPIDVLTIPLYGARALEHPIVKLTKILEDLITDTLATSTRVNFTLHPYQDSLNAPPASSCNTTALFLEASTLTEAS